jgi:glycosyltransferase involved in cell wall biosynthesis
MILDVRVMAGTGGGPEKTILRTPGCLDTTRYQMAAAYIQPIGDPAIATLAREAAALGCPLHSIAESGPLDLRTPLALLKLCRELNVAIWHGHDYKSDVLGLLLRRFHPMKLITTLHGWTDETPRVRFYRRLDDFAIKRFDHVIAVSPVLYGHCRSLGVAPNRLTLLPNGIDPAEWPLRTARPAGRTVGVVGRLSREKGVDRLLPVIATLRGVTLELIGDGPERAALEAQAASLRITDRVNFRGWQKPLQPWYERLDVLVLPSRTEGVPNAVLEAMSTGVPVAATNVGGVSDLLDGGRCGVLLSPEENAWGTAIAGLLDDSDNARRYAALARQRVEQHFTFRGRIDRLMSIYDRLLDRADKQTIAA